MTKLSWYEAIFRSIIFKVCTRQFQNGSVKFSQLGVTSLNIKVGQICWYILYIIKLHEFHCWLYIFFNTTLNIYTVLNVHWDEMRIVYTWRWLKKRRCFPRCQGVVSNKCLYHGLFFVQTVFWIRSVLEIKKYA
jgi:hypothetical protein